MSDRLLQELTDRAAKERELRFEAVARERQETERRMRARLSEVLKPEFEKLVGREHDGEFVVRVLGSIRQRLQAQGIAL
jgi:uncharacterized protein YdeI (YjbR/CyaY-like superfamily)